MSSNPAFSGLWRSTSTNSAAPQIQTLFFFIYFFSCFKLIGSLEKPFARGSSFLRPACYILFFLAPLIRIVCPLSFLLSIQIEKLLTSVDECQGWEQESTALHRRKSEFGIQVLEPVRVLDVFRDANNLI